MSLEEMLKLHQELNPEAIAGKMSKVMMIIARSDKKDQGAGEFIHVMENFTPAEMAYVVCAHSSMVVSAAKQQVPVLGKMLEILKEMEDLKDKKF